MATQIKAVYVGLWNNPTPYTCECGTNTTLGNKLKHNRTLKHQAHLQKEIYRANGTLEEEERKQAIIDEKDKADRKEISRIKRNEYKKELATKTI